MCKCKCKCHLCRCKICKFNVSMHACMHDPFMEKSNQGLPRQDHFLSYKSWHLHFKADVAYPPVSTGQSPVDDFPIRTSI